MDCSVTQAQTCGNSKEGANEIRSQQLKHIRMQHRSLALAVPHSFTESQRQQTAVVAVTLSDWDARQVQLCGNSKIRLAI